LRFIEKGKKQTSKEEEARERKANQETSKKQAKGKKRKQTNQEASKQTLSHVLGFGRYPLSHKPSRPSKREAKSKI
jgi:ABC-type enterochelin transport system ATPase subunit